jgi:hypothetical protein
LSRQRKGAGHHEHSGGKRENPIFSPPRRRFRPQGTDKTDFAAIAFTSPIHDIGHTNSCAKTMVEPSKFDPFGEPVAIVDALEPASASWWLARTGAGLFWALVIAIVAARAVYFEPGVFNGLDRAIAFAHGLIAAL